MDDPTLTQPVMYKTIDQHSGIHNVYMKHIVCFRDLFSLRPHTSHALPFQIYAKELASAGVVEETTVKSQAKQFWVCSIARLTRKVSPCGIDGLLCWLWAG